MSDYIKPCTLLEHTLSVGGQSCVCGYFTKAPKRSIWKISNVDFPPKSKLAHSGPSNTTKGLKEK